ncbi:MAG TPA: calcium-binding protein [Allosphingosinicella sp.]|nr:calcium-binding protein [Allosphingosinicella sp.]
MKTKLQKYYVTEFMAPAEPFLLMDSQFLVSQPVGLRDAPLPAFTLREAAAFEPALPRADRAAQLTDRLQQWLDDLGRAERPGRAGEPPVAEAATPAPPQPTEGEESDLLGTINYLLDEILGLDRSGKLTSVEVKTSTDDDRMLTVVVNYAPGAWPAAILEVLPSFKLFSIDVDPEKLIDDHEYAFDLQAKIRDQFDGFVTEFVSKAIEGVTGPERGIAQAAVNALVKMLSAEVMTPLSQHLSESLLALDLPQGNVFGTLLGKVFDDLGKDYFKLFFPEIAKVYAKLGLSEILTLVTSGSSPDWAQAIRSVGEGVLNPVIDNIVTAYFEQDPAEDPKILDGIKFNEVFGNAIAAFLIDFETLNQEIIDDFLGIDGDSYIEERIADVLGDKLRDFIEDQFANAVEFLAGDFKAENVQKWFDGLDANFNLQEFLGAFFTRYAGSQLAELFVEIDSLPEQLLGQLGAWLGAELLGSTIDGALSGVLSSFTVDALAAFFGEATASVIGTSIFHGLGTILGAGIGTIAGSVIFELLDDIFDGAISDLVESILDWIQNESPQAFYETVFDASLNEFRWSGYEYSKDGSDELRLAVRSTMEAFQNEINTIIDFVGEPVSLDPNFDRIMFAWGKKHFNESFASYIHPGENNKLSYNRSAEHVATETIGAVLCHMDFHGGNAIVAQAYDLWRTDIDAIAVNSLSYFQPDALQHLQSLIGLARFANDYRQDPTYFDLLMGSDTPLAITILQQYFEADAKGFHDSTILRGSVLGFETIGSAAAGDTIHLDGQARRAIARGGNDIVYIGAARAQEIDGGGGLDTVMLTKSRGAYHAVILADGEVVLADMAANIQIRIADVELFNFNGTTMTYAQAFGPPGSLNLPPAITSDGGGGIAWINLAENGAAVTTVRANDANNDVRAYLIVGGADAALFQIDIASGALAFLTPPDFETRRDADKDGVYEVIVAAGDGWASDSQTLIVRVIDAFEGSTIRGTSFADTLTGGGHAETIHGGDGADIIRAGDGADFAFGEGGDDLIDGETGADRISGWVGNDVLLGGAGNDRIAGEDGADKLSGGLGADTLLGGSGGDTFVFGGTGDSRTLSMRSDGGKLRPDMIGDFLSGTDRIDLSAIDANRATGANDAFAFIGTAAFGGMAGQLRYALAGGVMRIEGDVDGDARADFAIMAITPTIQASDFIL